MQLNVINMNVVVEVGNRALLNVKHELINMNEVVCPVKYGNCFIFESLLFGMT